MALTSVACLNDVNYPPFSPVYVVLEIQRTGTAGHMESLPLASKLPTSRSSSLVFRGVQGNNSFIEHVCLLNVDSAE